MCSSHINVFYFIYDFHYFRLPSYHINTVSFSFCVCVCVFVCVEVSVLCVCARTCASNFLPTRGRFLKGGINYTRYNSYSRDKSAFLGITIPGIKMGSRKHYLSLE